MTPNSGSPLVQSPGPQQIQGAMPFTPGGNPYAGLAQGGLQGLAQQYGQSYNSALAQNEALYNNILGGYQNTLANQTSAQGAIQAGYGNLYNNVLSGIQGIGASQSQSIADTYAQQSGQVAQQLTNQGLGNTTVAESMQRGPRLDEQKAQIALANQIAQLNAGYQSNLGMAGLGQQNMANMQNTALQGQQLNWMNTVQAQYPNAAEYNSLFGMQGAWQQAQADRDLMAKLAQQRATVPAAYAGAPVPNRSMGSSGGSLGGGGLMMPMGGGQGGMMSAGATGANGVTGPPKNIPWDQFNNPAPYGAGVYAMGDYGGGSNMGFGNFSFADQPTDWGSVEPPYAYGNQPSPATGPSVGGGYDLYGNNAADFAAYDSFDQGSWF